MSALCQERTHVLQQNSTRQRHNDVERLGSLYGLPVQLIAEAVRGFLAKYPSGRRRGR